MRPYTIHTSGLQSVPMPTGAVVRHVDVASLEFEMLPTVWMLVDTAQPDINHLFVAVQDEVILAGIEGTPPFSYVGSAYCRPIMYHVYDGGEA